MRAKRFVLRVLPAAVLAAGFAGGAEEPADFDLAGFVKAARDRGEHRLILPPGRHRVAAPGAVHLLLQDASDLEIVGEGAVIVCTNRTRALEFRRCRNVVLQGLTIDYDPLPFTQGKVVAASPDNGWIDVRLDEGYPREPFARIDVVDPATRYRKAGMPFLWGTKAALRGTDIVRLTLAGIGKAAPVGSLASLSGGNDPGGVCHALTLEHCLGGMVLRNVTIHAAPGMGIVETGGEGGTVLDGVRIVPGPRPAGATEERLLSTSWDGILHAAVGRGPRVENCVIDRCGDDSWSVQSSDVMVLGGTGNQIVLAPRGDFLSVRPGDHLRLGPDGPVWLVRSLAPTAPGSAAIDAETLAKINSAPAWSLWKLNARALARATFDSSPAPPVGRSLHCPERQGNGFVFRHNMVHSPGRILVKAGGGIIEDNHLIEPHGLVVCPEVPPEASAGIRDLAIRGNTIERGGFFCPNWDSPQAGALSIVAEGTEGGLRPPGVFARIVIAGNTVRGTNGVNLVLASARGVEVTENRFLEAGRPAPPATGGRYQIDQRAVVWVGSCDQVVFRGNEVTVAAPSAGPALVLGPGATRIEAAAPDAFAESLRTNKP